MKDALQQVDEGNGGIGMKDMEDELRVLEEQLDAQDDDELFCVACNKEMRNEKALASHRKQKKHIENVEQLREELLKDEFINSDDLDSDENISGNSSSRDNLLDNSNEIKTGDKHDSEVKNRTELKEEQQDDTSMLKQKTRRKKGGDKKSSKNTDTSKELGCVVCKQEFPSKNKLFNHLKDSGHAVAIS
jgi:DnaJ family protein A protein 5